MATKTPLRVLVIGRADSDLWNSKEVKDLMKKGDDVQRVEFEADAILGVNAFRTFPKTVKFTLAVIEQIRKEKAKKVKSESGTDSKPKKKRTKKKADAEIPSPVGQEGPGAPEGKQGEESETCESPQ